MRGPDQVLAFMFGGGAGIAVHLGTYGAATILGFGSFYFLACMICTTLERSAKK